LLSSFQQKTVRVNSHIENAKGQKAMQGKQSKRGGRWSRASRGARDQSMPKQGVRGLFLAWQLFAIHFLRLHLADRTHGCGLAVEASPQR